ncbi:MULTISPECIES: winged helix-turn-helix domain-containing tetratricopeptide repeat protein [Aliiglaciecola]|uniref:winged helix-turn-helix domain-containing tetratricopeptide repeat protein n=1 Tax=Aliiglaciecola TaxID=1406885 RepID=UPI001C0934BC|nr:MULTISPECIES: winged helix-turn-helix domain-containing protein [Aliiglaciecola]MBU2880121.1 winged helix-turn-helix domain-containing protein [Aliiglaciecola lipolytica]MDO6710881.1 winged helix-turn-helix domain-containing protein [Aliiglaciecola sp. 2_MG-2023]MDO6752362.1 winged helix-turn-helix domain-containing protein [Aliiglaciecola sp. 1_MG-2023]
MIYQFNDYQLDTEKVELRCRDVVIAVEPQVFCLLQVLIENRHRVLSKDQLIDLIWQGKPLSDSVVSSRIKSTRKAIGDDGSAQKLIKTIHGRGFRFVGDISTLDFQTELATDSVKPHQQEIDTASIQDRKPSIIVLPFTCIQSSNEFAILPEGFVIDIILGLSRLRWLKVISRASSFQFSSDVQCDTIVSHTGAKYCLSGCIERVNKKLTLTIELSNLLSQDVIWIERIEGKLDDIHQMRTDIVNKAVATLEVQISTNEAQIAQLSPIENLDAWAAYHLGMAHLYRFTQLDNEKAISLFTRAIKLEPMFSRAYAGLSSCQYQNVFNRYSGCDPVLEAVEAKRSAQRSIELDPLDAFANFAMGRCFWLSEGPEDSLPWLERSLSINPNFAQAYYSHGLASVMSNNANDAKQDASQAIELSPLDPFLYGFYGVRAFSYISSGDYENARIWANHAVRQPGALFLMDILATVANSLAGHEKEAAFWAARAKKKRPDLAHDYFFRVLPFTQGVTRERINQALNKHNL